MESLLLCVISYRSRLSQPVLMLAPTGFGPAGDNWTTARIVAAGLGIRHVAAEVLPSGKADQVRRAPGCWRRVSLIPW